MTKSKQIGTAFEVQMTSYLKSQGFEGAYRPALSGSKDVGDVHPYSQPHWIVECKAGKSAENASVGQIYKWVEEAKVESANAGAREWILAVKRRGIGDKRSSEQDAYLMFDFEHGPALIRVSMEDAVKIVSARCAARP